MKRFLLLLMFATPFYMFGQFHSWDGQGLPSRGTIRCLNIFVNIIYDDNPEYNDPFSNNNYWPSVYDPALEGVNNTAIPIYLLRVTAADGKEYHRKIVKR